MSAQDFYHNITSAGDCLGDEYGIPVARMPLQLVGANGTAYLRQLNGIHRLVCVLF